MTRRLKRPHLLKKKKKTASRPKTTEVHYNEHDYNQTGILYRKSKKRRLKKRFKRLMVLMVILLVIGFFASPLSRVNQLSVSGNHYLTSEAILQAAGVSPADVTLLVNTDQLEEKLKSSSFILDCQVSKGLFNGVTISVTERPVIAYEQTENGLVIVDDVGNYMTVDGSYLQEVIDQPRLLSFEHDERFSQFCKNFSQLDSSVRSMMSDITYAPEDPYDMERIQINMNDGKVFYARIDEMLSGLKYYNQIMTSEPDGCIYDINGNKVYVGVCQE